MIHQTRLTHLLFALFSLSLIALATPAQAWIGSSEAEALPGRYRDQPVEIEPDGLAGGIFPWRYRDQPVEIEPDGLAGGAFSWRYRDQPVEIEPDGLAGGTGAQPSGSG